MRVVERAVFERIRDRLARLYGDADLPRLLQRLELLVGRYGVGAHCLEPQAVQARCRGWDQRDAVLITYGDMVSADGEAPLATLRRSALGSWDDIDALGGDYRLMADLVINHVSGQSHWFRAYCNGLAPERHYFIEVEPDADLSAVVRPRTAPLLRAVQTPAGERHVWATFGPDQLDVDFSNPDVLFEYLDILLLYVYHGTQIWKQLGTPCIHLPQTHEVVKLLRDLLQMLAPGVLLITETNVPHAENLSYFGAGDEAHMVYQFSLPPLLLHALRALPHGLGGQSRAAARRLHLLQFHRVPRRHRRASAGGAGAARGARRSGRRHGAARRPGQPAQQPGRLGDAL